MNTVAPNVALRVRAWIETKNGDDCEVVKNVALRVRAWIETFVLIG